MSPMDARALRRCTAFSPKPLGSTSWRAVHSWTPYDEELRKHSVTKTRPQRDEQRDRRKGLRDELLIREACHVAQLSSQRPERARQSIWAC